MKGGAVNQGARWAAVGVLFLVGLLGPREGHAGKMHFEPMPLGEVVQPVTRVVVASPSEPARTVVEQPYDGELPAEVKDVPPFRTAVAHYVVQSVAWPEADPVPAEGQTIDVWAAGTPAYRDDHYDYYMHGVSKHSIHPVYTPSYGDGPAPDPVVLLLAPRVEGGFWLYATEAPAKLPEIMALVKKPAAAPAPVPPTP